MQRVRQSAAIRILKESETVGKLSRTRQYVVTRSPGSISSLRASYRRVTARWFRNADLGGRTTAELSVAGQLMSERGSRSVLPADF